MTSSNQREPYQDAGVVKVKDENPVKDRKDHQNSSLIDPGSLATQNDMQESSSRRMRQQYALRTKSQDSSEEAGRSNDLLAPLPDNKRGAKIVAAFRGESSNMMKVIDQEEVLPYISSSNSKTVQRSPGLSPREGLSPNQFMFAEKIPVRGKSGIHRNSNVNDTNEPQVVSASHEEEGNEDGAKVGKFRMPDENDLAEVEIPAASAAAAAAQDSQENIKNDYSGAKATDTVHKYEVWEGARNFWCKGKLQTGPDTRNLIIVILLINVTNGLSLGFSWVDYAVDDDNYFPLCFGVTLVILVNIFLYLASTTDPGMVPKQADDEHTYKWRREFKNYLIVDGLNGQKAFVTRLKFCFSCMIIRPKRSVHCRACDVCVENFDHHCPFISNCVGKRNYVHFWFFINLLWIDVIYIIWVTSHDIERRKAQFKRDQGLELGLTYLETLKEMPVAPLMLLFCAFVLVCLTVLVVYHYYLGSTFQTTYEHRKGAHSSYRWRPFDSGSLLSNLYQRVFQRKSPRPVFDPLEKHMPEVQNFKPPALKTPQSLIDQSHSMVSNSQLSQQDMSLPMGAGLLDNRNNDENDSELLGLEQIRPQLDSEDFNSPQDSQENNFADSSSVKQQHQLEFQGRSSVGPKPDLIGDGASAVMQARQVYSPSLLDSQTEHSPYNSDQKQIQWTGQSRRKQILQMDDASLVGESAVNESGLVNLHQISQDGISDTKVRHDALGPQQRTNNRRERDHRGKNHDSLDKSRERRSPENFYPSPRPLETNDMNVVVTENADRHLPFSPKVKKMSSYPPTSQVEQHQSNDRMQLFSGARIDQEAKMQQKRLLEDSFREYKSRGKLDQDVPKMTIKDKDDGDGSASEDFDFDDIRGGADDVHKQERH